MLLVAHALHKHALHKHARIITIIVVAHALHNPERVVAMAVVVLRKIGIAAHVRHASTHGKQARMTTTIRHASQCLVARADAPRLLCVIQT